MKEEYQGEASRAVTIIESLEYLSGVAVCDGRWGT